VNVEKKVVLDLMSAKANGLSKFAEPPLFSFFDLIDFDFDLIFSF
jgi:hypothetical protein